MKDYHNTFKSLLSLAGAAMLQAEDNKREAFKHNMELTKVPAPKYTPPVESKRKMRKRLGKKK